MRNSQGKCLALCVLKSKKVLPLAYLVNSVPYIFVFVVESFFIDLQF